MNHDSEFSNDDTGRYCEEPLTRSRGPRAIPRAKQNDFAHAACRCLRCTNIYAIFFHSQHRGQK